MSNIAIFTDIHLGIFKDSTEHINETKKIVSFILDEMKQCDSNKAFFLGDFFHSRSFLNVNTLDIGIELILSIADKVEIWFILGNHDIYFKHSNEIHSLKFLELIKHKNIHLVSKTTETTIDGKEILLVPWLGTISSIKKYDYVFGHLNVTMTAIKHFFAKVKRNENVDFSFLQSYLTENDILEAMDNKQTETIVNNQGYEPQSIFDFVKDGGTIFSGHFHMNDMFERNGKRFIYVGSPRELTWADEGNKKGFYILNPANDKKTFVENTFSPKHSTILYTTIKNNSPEEFKKLLQDNKNNFLKLLFDINIEYSERNKIFDIIQTHGNTQKIQIESTLDDNANFKFGNIEAEIQKFQNSKFDFVLEFIKTIPESEFQSRNISKDKAINILKKYYQKVFLQ